MELTQTQAELTQSQSEVARLTADLDIAMGSLAVVTGQVLELEAEGAELPRLQKALEDTQAWLQTESALVSKAEAALAQFGQQREADAAAAKEANQLKRMELVRGELRVAQTTLADREAELMRYQEQCYVQETELNLRRDEIEEVQQELQGETTERKRLQAALIQARLELPVHLNSLPEAGVPSRLPFAVDPPPKAPTVDADNAARILRLESELARVSQLYEDAVAKAEAVVERIAALEEQQLLLVAARDRYRKEAR